MNVFVRSVWQGLLPSEFRQDPSLLRQASRVAALHLAMLIWVPVFGIVYLLLSTDCGQRNFLRRGAVDRQLDAAAPRNVSFVVRQPADGGRLVRLHGACLFDRRSHGAGHGLVRFDSDPGRADERHAQDSIGRCSVLPRSAVSPPGNISAIAASTKFRQPDCGFSNSPAWWAC